MLKEQGQFRLYEVLLTDRGIKLFREFYKKKGMEMNVIGLERVYPDRYSLKQIDAQRKRKIETLFGQKDLFEEGK